MTIEVRMTKLHNLINTGQHDQLDTQLGMLRLHDVVTLLVNSAADDQLAIYRALPEGRQIDLFTALDDEQQLRLMMVLSTAEKRTLLAGMALSHPAEAFDYAGIDHSIPQQDERELLKALPSELMARVKGLFTYPQANVGRQH